MTHVRLGEQPLLNDAGLVSFEGLTNLIDFGLSKGSKITDAGVAHLRNLPRLEALWLDGTCVTDVGLAHLKGLPTLKVLGLRGTGVTDAGLVHLEHLPQLRLLALGGSRITDAGLVHLRGLARLEELWLETTRVTDAGLVHLRGLTKLRGLILFGTGVTDAGLEHLQSLTQLEGLMLGGRPVTDAGLARLGSLTKLKSLWLDGTRVTDAGLVHLQAMKELKVLNLDGTRVTDAGLVYLQGLTRLEELHLKGTGLTETGVEGLKKMLPACQVSADTAALEKRHTTESRVEGAPKSVPGVARSRAGKPTESLAAAAANGPARTPPHKPPAPSAAHRSKRAAKIPLPPTSLVHVDEFNDPRSGLPRDLNIPHNPDHGRSDGVFFVYAAGGYWYGWNIHDIRSDGTCQVVARVLREDLTKPAAWLVLVSTKLRGFVVRINAKGELFLEPSRWKEAESFRQVDPTIGPIIHPAIRPGNEFNQLLLVMRKREVVIFVNGAQVAPCEV